MRNFILFENFSELKMKKLIISILLCIKVLSAYNITGYVKDAQNGEPLPFANVMLVGEVIGAATDVHGYYMIPTVPPGNYTMRVMMMGYDAQEKNIEMVDENVRHNFELSPIVLTGEGVSVTAERTRFEKKVELSRVHFTPMEIKSAPTFGEADVFRTLQTLPSVVSPNDFSSALIVRGGSPDENLILLDMAQVFNPYHVGGVFSTFNTDIIADSEFMAGGYSARYGGSLSSVLEITSREGDSKNGRLKESNRLKKYWDFSKAKGEISMISSKIAMEGPLHNGSWMLSFRRTYFDQLAKIYYKFSKTDPSWDYWFSDLQFKAQYNINPNNKLVASIFNGHDDLWLDIGGNDGEEENGDGDEANFPRINFGWDWGNRAQSLEWRWTPKKDFYLETQVSHSQYVFDIDFKIFLGDDEPDTTDAEESTENVSFQTHNDVQNYSVRQDLTWIPNSRHNFNVGWEVKNLDLFYQDIIADNEMIPLEHTPNVFGAYIRDTWFIIPNLAFDIAVRINQYEHVDKTYFAPRLGIKYNPSEDLALKMSWGKYHQYLFTINQDEELLRMVDMWQPIPKGEEPQQAEHFIIGAEYWVTEGTKVSLEYYWKPYLRIYDLSATLERGLGYDAEDQFYTAGTGSSEGIELLYKRRKGKMTGWIGLSSSKTEKVIDLNNDGTIDPDYEHYRSKYDTPFSLNVVASYQKSKKVTYGISITSSSGQNYTPVMGKVYSQNLFDYESMDNPYASMGTIPNRDRNSGRFPLYFRFDASYSKVVDWWNIDGKFKLQILNLTNHYNVLFYNWDHDSTPSQVSAFSMFPITITFGWEFEI